MQILKVLFLALFLSIFSFAQSSPEVLQFKAHIGFGEAVERIVAQKFFDGDNKLVFVGIQSIQFWDVPTGKLLESRPHEIPNLDKFDMVVTISPDGQKAVVLDSFTWRIIRKEKKVSATVWDLRTGKQIAILKRPSESIRYAEWSKDGQTLLTLSGAYNDKKAEVSFWEGDSLDFKNSMLLTGNLRLHQLIRNGAQLFTVRVKYKDEVFGGISQETYISVRSTENAKVEQDLTYGVEHLLVETWRKPLSANENFFVASASGKLLVWEIGASNLPKYEITPNKKGGLIWFQNFSDDGKLLIARQDKNLEFYDTETGKLESSIPNTKKYQSVNLLSDGTTLVLQNCDRADVFNFQTRQKLYELKLVCKTFTDFAGTEMRDADALNFHPNGKFLLTNSDKTVRVWNAKIGSLAQTIVDPNRAENKRKDNNKDDGLGRSAGWLRNGDFLFASGADGKTILLWEMKK